MTMTNFCRVSDASGRAVPASARSAISIASSGPSPWRADGRAVEAGKGRRAFQGNRIGRGAGVGRVLASRDRYAAFRARRVVVKARIVKMAGRDSTGRAFTCATSNETA